MRFGALTAVLALALAASPSLASGSRSDSGDSAGKRAAAEDQPAAAAEQHGRLRAAVRARVALPGVRAAAWRLEYSTSGAGGEPAIATGALLTPESNARQGGPLIALGVGSQGLGDACAPSRNLRSGALLEAPLIGTLVARGWSVVVPDGLGLGTPGAPTYAVARVDGRAMLDAVRAAREVDGAGLPTGGPVGLLGYSVGGGTVAAAAELQPSYAPEIALTAAAAGGAVVDVPSYVQRGLQSGATVAAMSALVGQTVAFPELRLDRFLTPRGRTAARIAAQSCIYPAIVATALLGGRGPTAFVRSDPFDDDAWRTRAATERLGQRPPAAPVLLFHGTGDQAVPIGPVRALRDAWRTSGARVDWLGIPSEHIGAMVAGQIAAIGWLAQRFAAE